MGPDPGRVCVENSKENATKRASATAASPNRPFDVMAARRGAVCGDAVLGGQIDLPVCGRSATSSPAMASTGRPDGGPPGKAAISPLSRAVAWPSVIRARPTASNQGSRSDRASSEMTLSNCPRRSSPTEANKNGSNSRPISGDSAAWVISSNRFCVTPTPNVARTMFFALGEVTMEG
jgi:hypothetical protein